MAGEVTLNDALWEQHKDDWKDEAPAWCRHCKRLDHFHSRITGLELVCSNLDWSMHHFINSDEKESDCPLKRKGD